MTPRSPLEQTKAEGKAKSEPSVSRQTLSELEKYARKQITAERYPNDAHFFRPYACDACGVVPLKLTIEHHTGSKRGDFKGVIWGECTLCGARKRVMSYTGNHRKPLREEKPAAPGHTTFVVAEMERIERDDGMMGFFDKGVIVGQCARCEKTGPWSVQTRTCQQTSVLSRRPLTGEESLALLHAIVLAMLSSMLYHVFIKMTPQGAHPALSLFVTYGLATLLCGGMLLVQPLKTSLTEAFQQLNWSSYALALAIVGLEIGLHLGLPRGLADQHRRSPGQYDRDHAADSHRPAGLSRETVAAQRSRHSGRHRWIGDDERQMRLGDSHAAGRLMKRNNSRHTAPSAK